MQKLEIFQSLWAMELRQPGRGERPMNENFSSIERSVLPGRRNSMAQSDWKISSFCMSRCSVLNYVLISCSE